jgi:hypothetical protein
MDYSVNSLDAEASRYVIAERRLSRTATPRVPATAHRHLLAQRLRRFAARVTD